MPDPFNAKEAEEKTALEDWAPCLVKQRQVLQVGSSWEPARCGNGARLLLAFLRLLAAGFQGSCGTKEWRMRSNKLQHHKAQVLTEILTFIFFLQ